MVYTIGGTIKYCNYMVQLNAVIKYISLYKYQINLSVHER